MLDHNDFKLNEQRDKFLTAGMVDEEHFWALVSVSGIHSRKVILALRMFLVNGTDRKKACEEHDVSASYFCVALKKLQRVHNYIAAMVRYYLV